MVAQSWDFLRQVGGEAIGKLADVNLGTSKIIGDLKTAEAGQMGEAMRLKGVAADMAKSLGMERATNRTQRAIMQSTFTQTWKAMERMGLSETARLWKDFQTPVLASAPIFGQIFGVLSSLVNAGNETNLNQQSLSASIDQLVIQGINAGAGSLMATQEAARDRASAEGIASQQATASMVGAGISAAGSIGGGFAGRGG
jgi:hypothetical protein